jgi:hypothetical protein
MFYFVRFAKPSLVQGDEARGWMFPDGWTVATEASRHPSDMTYLPCFTFGLAVWGPQRTSRAHHSHHGDRSRRSHMSTSYEPPRWTYLGAGVGYSISFKRNVSTRHSETYHIRAVHLQVKDMETIIHLYAIQNVLNRQLELSSPGNLSTTTPYPRSLV